MSKKTTSQQFEEYIQYTGKEIEKAIKAGLNKAARTLKKNTLRQLLQDVPNAGNPNPKWEATILLGVLLSKYDKKKSLVKVHVMGARKLKGTHRLRFFENGAVREKRGTIQAKHFFQSATQATPVDKIIEETIDKTVKKINQSKL